MTKLGTYRLHMGQESVRIPYIYTGSGSVVQNVEPMHLYDSQETSIFKSRSRHVEFSHGRKSILSLM